jgi:hypothetical protein
MAANATDEDSNLDAEIDAMLLLDPPDAPPATATQTRKEYDGEDDGGDDDEAAATTTTTTLPPVTEEKIEALAARFSVLRIPRVPRTTSTPARSIISEMSFGDGLDSLSRRLDEELELLRTPGQATAIGTGSSNAAMSLRRQRRERVWVAANGDGGDDEDEVAVTAADERTTGRPSTAQIADRVSKEIAELLERKLAERKPAQKAREETAIPVIDFVPIPTTMEITTEVAAEIGERVRQVEEHR